MPDQPNFAVKILTPPAGEPVSMQEMRNWLRVDGDDDDDKIGALITTARSFVETYTRRICLPTTFTLTFDRFSLAPNTQYATGGAGAGGACQPVMNNVWPIDSSAWAMLVPRSPLISATIQYTDNQGNTQTMDPATYRVDSISEPGRLTPVNEGYWPEVIFGPNVVQVTFVAGYANAAAVPFEMKTAIKMITAAMYEDPTGMALSSPQKSLPMWLTSLLDSVRVQWSW